MMTDDHPGEAMEDDMPIDDRLTIKVNGAEHLVDSIVQFRRSKVGISHFKLTMCCPCCKQQSIWHTKKYIQENACQQLVELAHQAEELGHFGVDIESQQRTSEGCSDNHSLLQGYDEDDFDCMIDAVEAPKINATSQIASLELAGVTKNAGTTFGGKIDVAAKRLRADCYDLKKNQSFIQSNRSKFNDKLENV